MPRAKPIEARGATTRQVAERLEVNERHVRELAERGIIPRRGPNGWDLDACLSAYIRHTRAVAAGRTREHERAADDEDANKLSLSRETARLNRAKADAEELKLAELRGELVRKAAVREAIVAAWSHVRAHLVALPSKGAPMVHGLPTLAATKAALDELMRDALDELASTRSLPVGVDLSRVDWESADEASEHVAALREPLERFGLEVVIRERKPVRRRGSARDSGDVVDSAGSVGGVAAAAAPVGERVGRRRKNALGRVERGAGPLAD